eukprot:gnl/MRDRNA2_/MRDRNA2_36549_c0_seq1.p1 gnl/MRDRNA2_/MRDRNA2_36549_c0~~gnl/MRDRNA2_/MRDRNA2_36549_c0_seq1.p1  ORF type:complete len:390 (-),score=54.65 gnl/MRDRNA2_/MRDRNA2_36549_c0_seq1:161-1252(-)
MECASYSTPLKDGGLITAVEMLTPQDIMQLPLWSRSALDAVSAAHPFLELSRGCVQGRKVCVTWSERLTEMEKQSEQIVREMSMGEGKLTAEECIHLCKRVRHQSQKEPNIVAVRAPVVVVGDVHGQFLDLLQIFNELTGPVPETNYLFLGNYINRGYDSCSTICLLLLLKARYPNRITLLRGNHESRQISQVYNFYDECQKRFYPRGAEIWQCLTDCFDYLPLSAVIEDRIFCVHSGLSPSLDSLDIIRELKREQEIPNSGPMHDILWTDPSDRDGWSLAGRSVTFNFGPDITQQFLHNQGLSLMARAHQLVMEGFAWMHDRHLVTIFSAPNYCGRCGNEGAVMLIDDHQDHKFQRFGPKKH